MAEPAITFGANALLGTLTGWSEQDTNSDVNSQRAAVLNSSGNEAASNLHNERTDYSVTAKATTTGAPTVPATIGALLNSTGILTEINISTTAEDFVTLSLTAHQHTNNPHVDDRNQAAHGITLSAGFGATDFLGGTAGSDAAVASSSIRIACDHEDIANASGNHLIGENYNGKIESETVWSGVPTTPVGSGWDKVSVVTQRSNTGFLTTTARAEKALALS